MIIQCPNCDAMITSRGFKNGDRCLSCYEPLNMKECIMVEDRRKPDFRTSHLMMHEKIR